MSTEVHNLVAKLRTMGASQAARELGKFSGAVNTGTKSLSQMQLIGGVTAGMLVRDLAQGFIRAAKEGIVMAGQFQTAATGFERLTARFDDGVISLESLRKATKGTVNDLALLQTANKAVALGLPVERMNELFDIASKLGPLMGRTVTEAVTDLSLGIGRQSRMILDNLGIVISAEEAYEEYAATLGKVASELTKAERDQAFLNAAIAEGTRVTDQVGDAMSEQQEVLLKTGAAWDNLKIAIGEAAGELLVFGYRLTEVEDLTDRFGMLGGAFDIPPQSTAQLETVRRLMLESSDAALVLRGALEQLDSTTISLSTTLYKDYVNAVRGAMWVTEDFENQLADVIAARERMAEWGEERFRTAREEEFLEPLEDALDASSRSSRELNLELMKLGRSLDLGTISQETYDAEAKRIRDTLADLRIRQEELRLAIDDTTAAILAQGQAFQGLPPPLEEGALTFEFPSQDPLMTGVTGGGGRFQVMAMGGQRGPTRTTTITINLTGEQIAGKTRAEIKELARQLAEELAEEMRIRGVG